MLTDNNSYIALLYRDKSIVDLNIENCRMYLSITVFNLCLARPDYHQLIINLH